MTDLAMTGKPAYERRAHDAYWTPAWCTRALLNRVVFRGSIWEPACGVGNIATVLEVGCYDVVATDIVDHGYMPCGRTADFLTERSVPPGTGVESIVTNPPYSHAYAFVQHALNLTEPAQGMVAMLLRNEWDSADGRRCVFADHPAFCMKLVLTRRPRWSEQDTASPRHNFSWFIWDWRHAGKPPTIAWGP